MESFAGILMDAFFVGLLIWCSYTDIRKRIVPNIAIVSLLCLGVTHIGLAVTTNSTWWTYPTGMVFAVPFFISWIRGSMGAGDVKLVIAITLYLGLLNTIAAFALMVPVLMVVMVRSWRKNKTLECQIPFAPVLAFGAIGTVLIGYLYALTGI